MRVSIALAGKGGTGKTTLAGMLIKYLRLKQKTPILAVDADSNANLNEVLGVEIAGTVGGAREEMKKGDVPSGMTKDVFMSMKLEQSIVEAGDFDLVVMGQPEGTGCYCAANTILTNFLDRLIENYPYIVTDNEAGMEHISRLTTKNVDALLIVADASRRGLQAAIRIRDLAENLNIGVGKSWVVLNRLKGEPDEAVLKILKEQNVHLAGVIQDDPEVYDFDLAGRPTIEMSDDNPAFVEACGVFDRIFSESSST
ncbi:conserved hypothetical protein [Candidatus Desulfarcum epimagneticum]|uniref:CobQ/CobB/MinD/ParA nucleotide binding domain-containing protein n=1 Tax=uncultured Desulfobacteraceae bacterium TaxID=218296 RepID=A0A484HJH0_9BACT|nr:conserved hypothetical protein [uncultured Desulfobacteraceae bacterium]